MGNKLFSPPTNELPIIFNIVNTVDNRLAYADVNENVIINFTVFGEASSTRSLIHPDAPPITVANGTPLQRCHLETGTKLLNKGGFFSELIVGGATYSYTNISETISGGTTVKGDVNLDCVVDLLDVAPFIDRISTAAYQYEADMNDDGVINLLDVDFFVDLLNN